MRTVPYTVPPSASYYDYPISMAAMYRGFPLAQFNPALLFSQGTRQGEATTSVDSLLPTVSSTSVAACASSVAGQAAPHYNNLASGAPQAGVKNELLTNSDPAPSATEFDPYNLGLVSPTVSKNLEADLSVEKSKPVALKAETGAATEAQGGQHHGLPALRLIHLSRGELLSQSRGRGINLRSYSITEDEYDKMEEDPLSQKKMPARENMSPLKPIPGSAFQPTSALHYPALRPAVPQNLFQPQAPPAQVDSQPSLPHADLSQTMKKRNEGWIGSTALSHSYTSELPQQGPPSVCQVDNQTVPASSYEESGVDVKEKLLPSLYNNAFYSGYTPSGSILYPPLSDKFPAVTTQTIATTSVLANPTTTASLSSSSSTSSSPPSSSPFTSTTAATSVSANASIATALVNPMTLLAETEECDDDGFPIVDDTDESEFSALDLAMLSDH